MQKIYVYYLQQLTKVGEFLAYLQYPKTVLCTPIHINTLIHDPNYISDFLVNFFCQTNPVQMSLETFPPEWN